MRRTFIRHVSVGIVIVALAAAAATSAFAASSNRGHFGPRAGFGPGFGFGMRGGFGPGFGGPGFGGPGPRGGAGGLLAAAEAIAAVVKPDELSPEYVIPSVFNREVAPLAARAGAALPRLLRMQIGTR